MNQRVTIKLKPHLQEFIKSILNDECLYTSRKSVIGAMITPFVEIAPKNYVFSQSKGPDYITLTLAGKLSDIDHRGAPIIISEENQKNFERLLGIYFKDIFFRYVDDKIRYTNEIKKCILMFCRDYNISFTHITYEMLKKAYYRYKKCKPTPNIFSPDLSLSLSIPFIA